MQRKEIEMNSREKRKAWRNRKEIEREWERERGRVRGKGQGNRIEEMRLKAA